MKRATLKSAGVEKDLRAEELCWNQVENGIVMHQAGGTDSSELGEGRSVN